MPTIKRFVSKTTHESFLFPDEYIFRAMRLADNNHLTLSKFGRDEIIFSDRVKGNKSRLTQYELVEHKHSRGTRVIRNGDYIFRRDGKIVVESSILFDSKFKETSKRINS